jgi:hypothetical protein
VTEELPINKNNSVMRVPVYNDGVIATKRSTMTFDGHLKKCRKHLIYIIPQSG